MSLKKARYKNVRVSTTIINLENVKRTRMKTRIKCEMLRTVEKKTMDKRLSLIRAKITTTLVVAQLTFLKLCNEILKVARSSF